MITAVSLVRINLNRYSYNHYGNLLNFIVLQVYRRLVMTMADKASPGPLVFNLLSA